MTISNRQLIAITTGGVLLYATVFLLFVINYLGIEAILAVNITSAFLILFYWITKQFRITTHYFEFREMLALAVEVIVFSSSLLGILYRPASTWLEIPGYLFFGLHFIALLLFLIFALTFKMKRLF